MRSWHGHGMGVAWAWHEGVAWAWPGRGMIVAWAWHEGMAWAWHGHGMRARPGCGMRAWHGAWHGRGMRAWHGMRAFHEGVPVISNLPLATKAGQINPHFVERLI